MTPEEIETYRKESKRNVAMAMQESEEQKFREYIEKPTLIEALVQIQKRMATLEARLDRIEIHQQTQQTLVSDESECSNSGISDEYYYGGHKEQDDLYKLEAY